MQKRVAIGMVASLLALWMTMNLGAQVPPSDYNKNSAAYRVTKLAENAQPLFDQYQRFKDSNRLNEPGSMGFSRGVELSQQMRELLTQAVGDYLEALKDGWPESDSALVGVRTAVEAMRAKMEPCGMWTSFQFGEPYLRSGDYTTLNNSYDRAREGAAIVGKGELDSGAEQLGQADEVLARLQKQISDELDRGEKGAPTDIAKSPAYLRTVAELRKFKDQTSGAFAKAQEARGAVTKDVEAFLAVAAKCTDPLKKVADGSTSFSGTIDEINKQWESLMSELEPAQQNLLPEAEKALASFAAQFGIGDNSDLSINIANNINHLTEGKIEFSADPGGSYTWLADAVNRFKEKRTFIVQNITDDIERLFSNPDGYREEAVAQTYDSMKVRLQLAAKADPQNAKVKELLGKFDSEKDKAVQAVEKAIDGRVWGPNSTSFQGPGDPKELVAAAIDYLTKEGWCDNPKSVILAARIDGDWHMGDLNLLGQPINWQLGMEVAFQSDKDNDQGLARIFYLSFYTRDPDKKLPWGKTGVGDNYLIRASKIKKGAGGGSSASTTAGFGRVFWLSLIVGNLLAGLLAAAPLLTVKVPQLKKAVDSLTPLRNLIGVVVLAIGLLAFLRMLLFHFAPFADILPQLSAILAGLILGRELLLKKRVPAAASALAAPADGTANDAKAMAMGAAHKAEAAAKMTAQKAQDLLIQNQRYIEKLEKQQVPIGIACLALGLLHLLFSGWILF